MSLFDLIKKILVSPPKKKEFKPLKMHPPKDFVPQIVEQSPHTNDMGVDPNEWFSPNPLDAMPIATENPEESDMMETEKNVKEPDNIHEVMYQHAIKSGGSWIGGSENVQGGSEERLEEFTPENDPYGGY